MPSTRPQCRLALSWCCAMAIVAGCIIGYPAFAVGTGFSLPSETFTPQSQLAPLQQELSQGSFDDAATRLDMLLQDHADELMSVDGGMLSFSAWLQTLPADQKIGLTDAYRKRFDSAAAARIEGLSQSAATAPEEYYAIARRYPFSSTAAPALVAAAERSLDLGDLSAAAAYYDLARRAGGSPNERERKQVETLHRLASGEPLHPLEPTSHPALAGKPIAPYIGPLPFDATWFNNPAAVGQTRFFPVAAGDRLFLASPRTLSALRDTGQVLWTFTSPYTGGLKPPVVTTPKTRAAERMLPDRIEGAHRPPLYTPAVLCDVYGQPQIVVARQLGEHENEYILRAFSAADGKPLWSSDTQPQLRDLSFGGTPAIGGRMLYAVALLVDQPAHDNATVVLAALDTLTGRLQWQATVGVFTIPRDRRSRTLAVTPWDDVWEQSEPMISGEAVYVTPNAGVAVKVGRFDGKVRWARPYTAAPSGDDLARSPEDLRRLTEERREYLRLVREARLRNLPPPPPPATPLDPALTERYTSTPRVCGERLLIAPADSFAVYALDITTGRHIWEKKDPEIPTLIGGNTTTAVFAGAAVMALDPANGQSLWKWEPPRGAWITGPAVMRGNLIHVPTNTVILTLNSADGTVLSDRALTTVPFWRKLIAGEAIRKLLEDATAGKAFGLPPAP